MNCICIYLGLRLEFSKISRNVLARPVMGTIFLVYNQSIIGTAIHLVSG